MAIKASKHDLAMEILAFRDEVARLREALQTIADGQVMKGEFTHADTVHTYQRIAGAALADMAHAFA